MKAASTVPSAGTGSSWAPEDLEAVPQCPFCGDTERATLYEGLEDRFFGTRGLWTLRCCAGCGGGYLDPRPSAATLTRAYDEYYTHHGPEHPMEGAGATRRLRRALRNGYLNKSLGYRLEPAAPLARPAVAALPRRRQKARRLVRDLPYQGPSARVLDVGCGNGTFLLTMTWAGWQAEGVDPDRRAVESARSHGLLVHEGTLLDVPLPHSSFDAITMNHVFEHLPDPLETLNRCRALLRPGGVLWLATPNLASPGHREYGRDWIGLDAPRHLALPTPESLLRVLGASGFEGHFLRPPPTSWIRQRSEDLRGSPGWLRRAGIELESWVQDLRAVRDPSFGEELVVLARPRG